MGNIFSISRHAVLRAIENGRVDRISGIFIPGPVWLVALVTALVAQCLFIRPSEVAVPSKEVSLEDDQFINPPE